MNTLRKFLFYATPLAMACWSTEVLAFTDFGQGRPATAQDLSGKSFCWNNGVRASYGADGKLSNSLERAAANLNRVGFPNRGCSDSTCWLGGGRQGWLQHIRRIY